MLKMICASLLFFLPCHSSALLEKMTLEEKVGQLLFVCFKGEQVNEDAVTLVQKLHVGGIIYYNWANGLNSPEQVTALSQELQTLANNNRLSIPLAICADQEGGPVTRLKNGCTLFPGNLALGMTGNSELAEEAAYIAGQELLCCGVTLNLAPVVDVNSNPRNPIIGIRSFSEDPNVVTTFAKKCPRWIQKSGSCKLHQTLSRTW